jgi:hypothetical protein
MIDVAIPILMAVYFDKRKLKIDFNTPLPRQNETPRGETFFCFSGGLTNGCDPATM